MQEAIDDPGTDPRAAAEEAAAAIARTTGVDRHDLALTLGSGWAGATALLGETTARIPAADVPGFTAPAPAGHTGTIDSILLADGRRALVLGARTHLYEGRGVRRVVHGVRTAAACGASVMVLTNGAGGLRHDWAPGTAVLLADHLNLTATSPIEGAHFVDLTDLYSTRLRTIAHRVDAELPEAVYAQFRGPHYETPAEVRMAGVLGAELVGMSTALEAIACREAGLEVLGLSLVTNPAAGVTGHPLRHDEVVAAGRDAEPRLASLLAAIVAAL